MPGKRPLTLSSRPVPGAAIGRDVKFQRRLLPGPPEITHDRAQRIDFRGEPPCQGHLESPTTAPEESTSGRDPCQGHLESPTTAPEESTSRGDPYQIHL
jgi:hypothetical protein